MGRHSADEGIARSLVLPDPRLCVLGPNRNGQRDWDPKSRTFPSTRIYKGRVVAPPGGVLAPFASTRPLLVLPERIAIPESFHSTETEEPFSTCLACEASLLDGPTEYLIEKGYRRYEAYDVQENVFEYAVCMDCHTEMRQSFSDASKQRCQAYLAEHIDLADRTGRLLDAESSDPEDWTRRCVVHGTPRDELEEYQVMAHCRGDEMLLTHLPLLMGGPAMDDLAELLSDETIDELGGFRDEHLGLPPELKRDLQGPVVA